MEEKGLDYTKPPLDLSPPIDRSVPRCCLMRQIGYKQKKTLVPNELQWAAEDSMINRSHEEFKCHLPDISRSTFLMVFSPDGKKVASTHGNHNVYVTDLTSGKNIKTLTGHPRTPWCIAFHPSSNQILASGCLGGQVRVWDLHGGSEIWTAESQTVIASLAFHPVDRMLVIASYNELHFWDWSQPEPFAKCYTANEKEKVRYVAFDHLGHKLITGVANAPARTTSQWDRVSVPQPPPQVSTLESERRITICYRYMVEQYEHLVQHYYDLSRRARTTPTMDRGTDPMDLEAESSHSSVSGTAPSTSNTPQPTLTSRLTSRILDRLRRRPETNQTTSTANDSADSTRNPFNGLFLLPNRRIGNPQSSQTPSMPEERERPQRVAAGTDETSASRSSTQFLLDNESSNIRSSELPSNTGTFTPINFLGNNMERTSDALESMRSWVSNRCPPNSESRLNNQRSPTSTDRGLSTFSNLSLRPSEVNPRNNSDLPHPPSFNSRQRNSPTATANNPLSRYQQILRSPAISSADQPTPNRPLSGLSPETIGFGLRRETETTPPESNSNSSPILRGSIHRVRQLVEDLLGPRRRRNLSEESTDMNPVDSDNETREEPPPTPQSEDEHSLSSLMNYFDRHSCSRQASPTGSRSTTPPLRRGSDTTSSTAVSRLRTQFRRLQTAYHSRSPTHSSHVLSAESQAAERRLLNRLNEILERPLEPRARRFLISRRSAFQFRASPATTNNPRPPTTNSSTSTSPALDISGVRYGIELLSRHIDNMQRLCRARLEILQLQQIRRMWEDLQSQIYALHGVVRDNNGNRPEPAPESGSRSETEATPRRHRPSAQSEAPDVLTDDDSDGANNDDLQWRPSGAFRRAPQQRIGRRYNKLLSQQNTRSFLKRPRSSGVNRPKDGQSRNSHFQFYHAGRRQTSTRTTSSQQATTSEELPSERGDASSSHVSGETSTGTGTSEEQPSVRGVKRKSRDSDSLFRPRPSTSVGTGPSTSSQQPSSLVSSMRDTIMQLESMVWRARARTAQRNFRLSRFTRQREERMLRNLWDTESSHESSRDDQSEGDSSQPSGNAEPTGETDWTRESTRLRARQVLLLMVDSLTQFFENDSLSRRTSNEALHERIYNLYVLLQLALNLTDLLLAQLVSSRRELEYRRHSSLPLHLGAENETWGSRYVTRSRHIARHLGRSPETWRRSFRRNTATAPPDTSQSSTPSTPSAPTENRDREQREPVRRASTTTVGGGSRGLPHRHHAVYSNIRNTMISRLSVPVVRVNGLPVPPVENNPPPRPRPHSPPPYPIGGSSPILTPRFLHPRYVGPNPFDESTSEDSSPQDRSDYSLFLRAGYGSSSIILNDTPMSPHHRIQAWDFSKYNIPDISNADKNIVVSECKIHNDASVDVSNDGRLLVTLLPSGRLSITTMLGVYSLQWETLGQLLYTTSFEQNAVSVSLSPTTRHLVVGLASRRVALVNNDRYTNAQVYRLEGATPGRKLPLGARGVLVHIRDLELSRNFGFMSLNCIRWAPNPGQGLVYGTNTGQLKILR